jgi:hypothetical protein
MRALLAVLDGESAASMPRCTNEPRDRVNRLLVAVNSAERQRIKARAAAAGLSVSGYLRAAGLGETIRNAVANHDAIMVLAKLNADQGRLGGLLKMWLVDRPNRGAPAGDVRTLLDDIRALQGQLADVAARL